MSAPFNLGVPAADIVQDLHMTHLSKINIFVPSEQNTFCQESSRGHLKGSCRIGS